MVITQPRARSARPGRFRRAAIGAALGVTAVAAAVWASASAPQPAGREAQSELTYVAEVGGPLAQEEQLAGVVDQVRTGGNSFQRAQLVADLVELDETAQREATTIASISPVGRVSFDIPALVTAAEDWSRGARLFEVGVLASIGPGRTSPNQGPGMITPPAEGNELWAQVEAVAGEGRAVSTLASAGAAMSAGDAAYRRFSGSVAAAHRILGKGGVLTDVRWDPDSLGWSTSDLAAFEQGLASSETLAPVNQVALDIASLDPSPIPAQGAGGVPTIVGTGAITVILVVANQGNVDATGVTVTVSFSPVGTPAPGAPVASSLSRRQSVDIEPGGHRSMEFTRMLLIPGHTYTMTASIAPPTGQASAAGTSLTRTFSVES